MIPCLGQDRLGGHQVGSEAFLLLPIYPSIELIIRPKHHHGLRNDLDHGLLFFLISGRVRGLALLRRLVRQGRPGSVSEHAVWIHQEQVLLVLIGLGLAR